MSHSALAAAPSAAARIRLVVLALSLLMVAATFAITFVASGTDARAEGQVDAISHSVHHALSQS